MRYNDNNEFEHYFPSCGDGARTYSLGFVMRGGRLVSCQVTPGNTSEVERSLTIFDATGRVVYDGPCDNLGNPTAKVNKK